MATVTPEADAPATPEAPALDACTRRRLATVAALLAERDKLARRRLEINQAIESAASWLDGVLGAADLRRFECLTERSYYAPRVLLVLERIRGNIVADLMPMPEKIEDYPAELEGERLARALECVNQADRTEGDPRR